MASVDHLAVPGLALTGTSLLAGTNDGVASLVKADGTGLARQPTDRARQASLNPVVDRTGRVIFGTTSSALVRVNGATSESVATSAALSGAPAIGADGLLYTSTTNGRVQAWSDGLTLEWEALLAGGILTGVSPALDCGREANGYAGGVLYVGGDNGKLFSLDVDSKGLDTQAPWPKFQHDPRNTGNSSTSLTEFTCP